MFGGPVGSFFYKYLGGIQAIDTNNRTAGTTTTTAHRIHRQAGRHEGC